MSPVQQTFTPAYSRRVPMTEKGTPNPECISSLCGARYANAQRSSHTAQDSRKSRSCPKSGGGMLHVGFKAASVLTLVCNHQVSHPENDLKSGRSRLPPIFGQGWTVPASPWVFKAEILP